MAAATVNDVWKASGLNEEWHDVTFAATGDTYASGLLVKHFVFSVKSTTGTNANGYKINESGGTFTLTVDGTANTNVRVVLHILKKR